MWILTLLMKTIKKDASIYLQVLDMHVKERCSY